MIRAALGYFSGLRSLAAATGWPGTLSPLLPFTIDAYAIDGHPRVVVERDRFTGGPSLRSLERHRRYRVLVGRQCLLASDRREGAHGELPIVVLVGAVPPAVLGLNAARLEHTAAQQRFWQTEHDGLAVRTSEDQMALRATLEAGPQPDVAVIATHGSRRLRVSRTVSP